MYENAFHIFPQIECFLFWKHITVRQWMKKEMFICFDCSKVCLSDGIGTVLEALCESLNRHRNNTMF